MSETDDPLVITVRRTCWRTRFSKPAHVQSSRYLVVNEGQTAVWVFWPDGDDRHPVHLEFRANRVITAVGFGETERGARQNKTNKKGPCGEGFHLLTDLTSRTETAVVENPGHGLENGDPYHFEIWLKDWWGDKSTGIDPQIYNEGDPHFSPPGEPPGQGKGGFLRFLRRLWWWLTD